jgi:hypothetical protein
LLSIELSLLVIPLSIELSLLVIPLSLLSIELAKELSLLSIDLRLESSARAVGKTTLAHRPSAIAASSNFVILSISSPLNRSPAKFAACL